jgi:sulfate transporter 4
MSVVFLDEESSKGLTTTNDTTLISDESGDAYLRHRRPPVTKHRQVLDHISTDATESRRHPVPVGSPPTGPESYRESTRGRCNKLTESCCETVHKKSLDDWLGFLLPAWLWLKTYEWRTTLGSDLVAGLTVGVMVVPQSMSYAKLAGLPVEYGLYSALVPVYAYAFFGSSRQLAVGPVALISLLLSTGLSDLLDKTGHSTTDSDYATIYAQLAIQTSFLVGVTYIAMGLLQLGFITIFLSHAVVSGFTTGAAVIIGLSQLKYIFGYNIPKSDIIYEIIQYTFESIDQFSWKTFLMGSLSILALVTLKHIGKQYPRFKWVRAAGPITVTVVSITLVVAFDLDKKGIPVVAYIPQGLPSFTAGDWAPIEDFSKLYMLVISIAIVGFMESIAIAKQLASKHKYEIDASTELIGLGMANFLGGMFSSYPITGSFSRSAVNNETGAKSGISGIVTATMVAIVLLFMTSVFEKLPLCVLGAIVISGVLGLLDYDEAIYLWKVHKFDFSVWVTACLGTMFLGVEIGLGIAVGVSLLIVIYESAYPHTTVLGRLPGTSHYRSIKQYSSAERYDGLVLVRIDAPLYFANAMNVREKIRKYRLKAEAEMAERNSTVKYLIIDMSPVSHIDTSALHVVEDMNENYRSRGQQLCFSNPSKIVMDRLIHSGLADKVGREHFFASEDDAVKWCLSEMDMEAVSIHESMHPSDDDSSHPTSDVEAVLSSSPVSLAE